jgi:hypothetical protein
MCLYFHWPSTADPNWGISLSKRLSQEIETVSIRGFEPNLGWPKDRQ